MRPEDADAVYDIASTALFESMEEREVLRRRTPEQVESRKARYGHFLRYDPEGAWLAEDDGRVSGVAISVRRERVWVLSLLAVDAEHRGTGLGGELLERALAYGEGCEGAMIASSSHPAAMRRYARADFDLHPTLSASGNVRRDAIPTGLSVREGEEQDLELASEVDRAIRGAAHGPDLEHMLATGCRLLIAEGSSGRGYAAERDGSPAVLAATEPAVARDLLWTCLERTAPGEKADVDWITGNQNWAVAVALEAGLSLSPAGPVCTRGVLGPLTPYLPSGPFL
jgi:GNAT superfamily N-acetyltransferase